MHTPYKLGPYLSVLSDRGFKAAFGNKNDTSFLCKALTLLIGAKVPITSVTFIENDYPGITKEGRGARLDLACEDEHGNQFIVEMQVQDPQYFIHRAKHYTFHAFNRMVQKGNFKFNNLKKIYMVSFLATKAYPTNLYHQIVTLKNQHGELVDDQITHVIVELGKFKKTLTEVKSDLDKLIYTMKQTANTNFQEAAFMQERWLQTALTTLKTANLTADQRMQLELDIAYQVSYEDSLLAKGEAKGEARGVARGRKEGRKEGRMEGRMEGKKEGVAEGNENGVVAMLKSGKHTAVEIADLMDMPVARVEAIRAKFGL